MIGYHDLEPAADPPPNASLQYEQPGNIPVTVKTERRGDLLTVDLLAHDELFDNERYVASPDLFAVAYAAGEDYVPPIPILKFPLNLGGPGWTWSGTLSSEKDPHPATATVSTHEAKVTVGASTFWTVRCDVDMVIAPYRNAPVVARHLSFWFEKGHGLIKRDFAGTQIRQPVFR